MEEDIFSIYGFTNEEVMGYAEFKSKQSNSAPNSPISQDKEFWETLKEAEEKISKPEYKRIVDIAVHTR